MTLSIAYFFTGICQHRKFCSRTTIFHYKIIADALGVRHINLSAGIDRNSGTRRTKTCLYAIVSRTRRGLGDSIGQNDQSACQIGE